MKWKRRVLWTLLTLVLGLAAAAGAATDQATQTVTITVEEIAQLSASGDPATLTLTNAGTTAGSLPTPATDASTSLSWSANVASGSRKLTAALDATFTSGIVLKAALAKPGGSSGSSSGQVTLSDTAKDIFTGITNENCTGATISFEASLSKMIAPVTNESKTLTWTLTAAQ
jgi:hypothetical protein